MYSFYEVFDNCEEAEFTIDDLNFNEDPDFISLI